MDMKNRQIKPVRFPLLCFLGAVCLLISCGQTGKAEKPGEPAASLADYCEERTQSFLLQKETAVLLQYRHLGETEEMYLCKDPEQIASFLDALSEITVTCETSLLSSDDSDLFLFTDADGETYSFSFNSHHFQVDKTQYELSGDAVFWQLADRLRTQF